MENTVKGTMTSKLITIQSGSTIAMADDLMREHRIRHLPVVDFMDDVVGVISHRDIAGVADSEFITVDSIMSAPVEYVNQDVSLRHVIYKMLENKISCMLIGDDKGDAVGILTTDDLLWCLANILPHDEDEDQKDAEAVLKNRTWQTVGEVAKDLAMMGI